ncbi:DHA1 family inner membrane transport protein [Nocardiopsis arvandica]|uniref:DHA1 family inner membrane transport protein n=1 Tax=Nocardiopsis sinuspersici TaxID=501010 RepID=A0A7Y9XIU8_9ACTN|nr:MFS transporter [Nocardiopsis sinuspersici]NYH55497.1 DHA1 family inner membrane transport protein [Nocardiopsis sinuspersici]
MPLALLALAVGAFAIGTTEFVIMGLLPEVATDLGVPVPTAGYLISAYALGVVVGAPLLTALSTRLPRKTVLLVFMGLFLAGNLATVLAPSFGSVFASRVLAGLPHGAYLGVGSLVAAHIAGPGRRATGVSRMFLGLTVANIVGVPAGTFLGQAMGWRAAFLVVVGIALLAMAGIAAFVPRQPSPPGTGLRHEVRELGRSQVVLGLVTAVFGFAGVFAVYSYVSPMMTELAGMSASGVPIVLALFGTGMTLGSLVIGPLADRALRPTIYGALASLAVVLVVFTVTVHNPWTAAVTVLVLGAVGFGVATPLQVLVMNKAAQAPTMAATSNHSAFNLANAAGAWLGGVGIGAGLGYSSPAAIGAVLAVVGLGIAVVAGLLDRPGRERGPSARASEAEAPEYSTLS